jgi:hypothetical protein
MPADFRIPPEIQPWITAAALIAAAWALGSFALSRWPLTLGSITIRVAPQRVPWRAWIAGGLWFAMVAYGHAVYSQTGFWLPDDPRSSDVYASVMFGISVVAILVGFAVGLVLW